MAADDAALMELVRAIVAGDSTSVSRLLAGEPTLATARAGRGATRQESRNYFLDEIGHYLYAGDTALHIAAAAHNPEMVRILLRAGADVDARNRRGAQPLHYAADGGPDSAMWRP